MNSSSWHLLMSYSSYDTTGRYSSPYGWCNAWWCKASIMYISLYSVVRNTSCSVLQLIVIECSIIELPYGLYSFPDATRHRVTLSTISKLNIKDEYCKIPPAGRPASKRMLNNISKSYIAVTHYLLKSLRRWGQNLK